MRRFLALSLVVGVSTLAQAQIRSATQAELRSIGEAFDIAALEDSDRCPVISIEGFSEVTVTSRTRLLGRLYCRPYVVQEVLCVMEVWGKSGMQTEAGFDWDSETIGYRNWMLDVDSDCAIESLTAIPEKAVETYEPIPSSTLARILSDSTIILEQGFRFAQTQTVADDIAVTRFLDFESDSSLSLRSVRITPDSMPGVGFAYSAGFRSSRPFEGPVVTFSITHDGIVVHSIGYWIS